MVLTRSPWSPRGDGAGPTRPTQHWPGQSTQPEAVVVVAQPAITACSWSVVTLFPLPAVNARDVRCGGIIGPYTARLHTLHGSALAWQVDGPRAYKYTYIARIDHWTVVVAPIRGWRGWAGA